MFDDDAQQSIRLDTTNLTYTTIPKQSVDHTAKDHNFNIKINQLNSYELRYMILEQRTSNLHQQQRPLNTPSIQLLSNRYTITSCCSLVIASSIHLHLLLPE
mmetsp:Transcript_9692/g.20355  ORF Transcript_9692/g.20355 Transcript_9692/m.20355 type:complete len:102 (-) Transcript_9692:1227-1532(-)